MITTLTSLLNITTSHSSTGRIPLRNGDFEDQRTILSYYFFFLEISTYIDWGAKKSSVSDSLLASVLQPFPKFPYSFP